MAYNFKEIEEEINSINIEVLFKILSISYTKKGHLLYINHKYIDEAGRQKVSDSWFADLSKNKIYDYAQKNRPYGTPYWFIVKYLKFIESDENIITFYQNKIEGENLSTKPLNLNKSKFSFEKNDNEEEKENELIISTTEPVDPSVRFTIDFIRGQKKRYEIPEKIYNLLLKRGIKNETILNEEVYYGKVTEYNDESLMFFSRNGKKNFVGIKLRNLYATDKKYKSINVRNSRVGLFFNPDFSDNETVFLCEGEMDYFILKQLNFGNVIANMGGVSSFMEDWLALFENKDIYILYDRDTPGINGMMRVKEIIEKKIPGKYKSINYLDFGEQGEDINDIYLRLKREGLSDKEIGKKIFENMKLIPEK